MSVTQIIYRGINIFSCCVQIIVAATLIYGHKKVPKPDSVHLDFSTTDMDSIIAAQNLIWTQINAPLVLGVFCIVVAIIEILLASFPRKVDVLNAPIFRGLVYIGLGVFALGIAGDLGIAAGILTIINGVLVIVFGVKAAI